METYPIGLPSCEWSANPKKPGHYFGEIQWTPTNQDEYYQRLYAEYCADEEWKRRYLEDYLQQRRVMEGLNMLQGASQPRGNFATSGEMPPSRPDWWRTNFKVGSAIVFRRKDGSGFGCRVQYTDDDYYNGKTWEDPPRWSRETFPTSEAAKAGAERLLLPLPARFTLEEWIAI
jgi:hypothetical protein